LKKFLTTARRKWLAKFLQNVALVLLAGMAGGELFLKISLEWRLVFLGAFVISFLAGLIFAVDPTKEED